MRSTSEALEGNRVKLTVEVDEDELRKAVDETFRKLQKEVNVPGFRPGKVPRRLLEVRLGSQAIRAEVIRHALPDYYAQAVEEADLDTIAAPEIDITAGEEDGPLAFDAVVEVRPKVSIAGYEGLVVTVPPLEPTQAEIDARIDRLREQFAQLSEVERPARDGDLVTVDVQGVRDGEPAEGLSADDFVYEVGTGGIGEGVDEALRGKKAGDIVDVEAAQHAGRSGQPPDPRQAGAREGAAGRDRRVGLRRFGVRHPRGAAGGRDRSPGQLEEARGPPCHARASRRRPGRAGRRGNAADPGRPGGGAGRARPSPTASASAA